MELSSALLTMSAEMPLTEKEDVVVAAVEEEEEETLQVTQSLDSNACLHGFGLACSGRWEKAPVIGVGAARHILGGCQRVLHLLLVVALNR